MDRTVTHGNRWRHLAAALQAPPPLVRRYATGVEIEAGVVRCVTLACGRSAVEVVGAIAVPLPAGAIDGLDIVDPDAVVAALAAALPVRRPATRVGGRWFGEAPLVLGLCPALVGRRVFSDAAPRLAGAAHTGDYTARPARARWSPGPAAVRHEVERGTGLAADTLAVDCVDQPDGRRCVVYVDKHHWSVRADLFAALGHTLTALVDGAAASINAMIWQASECEWIGLWAGARACAGWHVDTATRAAAARPLFSMMARGSSEAMAALRGLADAGMPPVTLAGHPQAVDEVAVVLGELGGLRPGRWQVPAGAHGPALGCEFAVAAGLALEGLLR
ncbi:hypothetical protein [Chitinasiproducens palmae]|uniref:Uncharacterized protein n=1 Tax=Chitinasiproducens palmae TaxID=1770053 RepID=A0A1H2PWJ8_9BURK|nr:hypothetical protein [Chitinasiproducens palmae]SDV51327.1 hypothetical protein SAMN05216551_11673 [Chitinasiproducens palmae]